MMFVNEFALAGKVIKVEERTNNTTGEVYMRVGIQTGTRGGDRAWLNMSKEWASGAERGKQAVVKVRFDATKNVLRPVEQPKFVSADEFAAVLA